MEPDRLAHELAARQHGVLARSQLFALGYTRSAIRHRLASDRWSLVTPRVLRIAGAPISDLQHAMAATLDVRGSLLSHESAAALWKLPGFRLRPLHLLRLRDEQHPPSALATIHTTTHLPERHRALHENVPIATPVRTLFDLAARLHPLHLARLVDTAWSKRLVSGSLLHATLEDHAERGRDGIQAMREVLETRGTDYRPPDSNLEARVQDLARSVGIRTLARQVEVGGDERIGRVDFSDTLVPLILEVDSDTYHGSVSDQESDRLRDRALERAGYVIERIAEFDVWHRPDDVRAQLRAARARARNGNLGQPGAPERAISPQFREGLADPGKLGPG